jgi:hypothetical protein
VDLIYRAARLDRRVPDVEDLLRQWRVREADWGQLYLDFKPATSSDTLQVEDLAVTMLINSRVAGPAAAAVLRYGTSLDLASLADKPLELTTFNERDRLAELIGRMTSWPWIGASLATKTLHKKHPRLIPILDNQAIFGAYMNPRWPGRPPRFRHVPRLLAASAVCRRGARIARPDTSADEVDRHRGTDNSRAQPSSDRERHGQRLRLPVGARRRSSAHTYPCRVRAVSSS